MVGAHVGLAPKINPLITGNQIETFCAPQGVLVHMCRAMAGHKCGVITHVGLKTFCDPEVEACCFNDAARKAHTEGRGIVQSIEIDGRRAAPLQADAPRCVLHQGHLRRQPGQSVHGEGGAVSGAVRDGPCYQEQRRHRHRPGGYPGGGQHPGPPQREGPRLLRGLCGGGAAGVQPPALLRRRPLPSGVDRRGQGAHGCPGANGAGASARLSPDGAPWSCGGSAW